MIHDYIRAITEDKSHPIHSVKNPDITNAVSLEMLKLFKLAIENGDTALLDILCSNERHKLVYSLLDCIRTIKDSPHEHAGYVNELLGTTAARPTFKFYDVHNDILHDTKISEAVALKLKKGFKSLNCNLTLLSLPFSREMSLNDIIKNDTLHPIYGNRELNPLSDEELATFMMMGAKIYEHLDRTQMHWHAIPEAVKFNPIVVGFHLKSYLSIKSNNIAPRYLFSRAVHNAHSDNRYNTALKYFSYASNDFDLVKNKLINKNLTNRINTYKIIAKIALLSDLLKPQTSEIIDKAHTSILEMSQHAVNIVANLSVDCNLSSAIYDESPAISGLKYVSFNEKQVNALLKEAMPSIQAMATRAALYTDVYQELERLSAEAMSFPDAIMEENINQMVYLIDTLEDFELALIDSPFTNMTDLLLNSKVNDTAIMKRYIRNIPSHAAVRLIRHEKADHELVNQILDIKFDQLEFVMNGSAVFDITDGIASLFAEAELKFPKITDPFLMEGTYISKLHADVRFNQIINQPKIDSLKETSNTSGNADMGFLSNSRM